MLINLKIAENLERVIVELNFCRKKWLVCCSISSRYENYLLLGDFNSEPSENSMIEFGKVYKLKNLVKGAAC